MLAYITYRRIISIIVRFFSVKEPTSITFHDEYKTSVDQCIHCREFYT